MKKILLSLMLLVCCSLAGRANPITFYNFTGCNFDVTFGLNLPLAVSGVVTIPPGVTMYANPGLVPTTWTPALTPAQLATATFMYLYASPVNTPTVTFLLRAGNGGYDSAAAGFYPACSLLGFNANWNVNSSNEVVVTIY